MGGAGASGQAVSDKFLTKASADAINHRGFEGGSPRGAFVGGHLKAEVGAERGLTATTLLEGKQLSAMVEETLRNIPPIETLVARLPVSMLPKALETAVQGLLCTIRQREVAVLSAYASQDGMMQAIHSITLFQKEKALQVDE